jgi:hypothetical protein
MRVFDENKNYELKNYDLEKGYLKADKIFVAFHPEVPEQEEQSHYEVIRVYDNGGKDVKKVIDVPHQKYQEAYEEYEDIYVYIPYTQSQIEKNKKAKYEFTVEKYIRERYPLNAELAILRQRDTKPDEFAEYYDYVEQCKSRAKIDTQYYNY